LPKMLRYFSTSSPPPPAAGGGGGTPANHRGPAVHGRQLWRGSPPTTQVRRWRNASPLGCGGARRHGEIGYGVWDPIVGIIGTNFIHWKLQPTSNFGKYIWFPGSDILEPKAHTGAQPDPNSWPNIILFVRGGVGSIPRTRKACQHFHFLERRRLIFYIFYIFAKSSWRN
jgi:hypothetical protein